VSFIFAGIYGLIVSGAVILGFIGAMAYAYKDFKGVSGDLAGYALVISELCGLTALAVI
jgi:adenosylcobinamide-GDP ribazoletransferase